MLWGQRNLSITPVWCHSQRQRWRLSWQLVYPGKASTVPTCISLSSDEGNWNKFGVQNKRKRKSLLFRTSFFFFFTKISRSMYFAQDSLSLAKCHGPQHTGSSSRITTDLKCIELRQIWQDRASRSQLEMSQWVFLESGHCFSFLCFFFLFGIHRSTHLYLFQADASALLPNNIEGC